MQCNRPLARLLPNVDEASARKLPVDQWGLAENEGAIHPPASASASKLTQAR